jgi:predicted nucleotidyltransferase
MLHASLLAQFDSLLARLSDACLECYGDSLMSLAVFGSVGRGTPRPDSDIDLLVIADGLPRGRMARMGEFQNVEAAMKPWLAEARAAGLAAELSPVIRMPEEVLRGSPLLLDMTEDARVLYDRQGFLQSALEQLRARLQRMGARRIWRGNAWFWDLKPDYRPGDVFEI